MSKGREIIQDLQRRERLAAAHDRKAGGRPSRRAGSSGAVRTHAVSGFILGVLLWSAAKELNLNCLPLLRGDYVLPAMGLLGALAAVSRFRKSLWWAGGALSAALLLVAYTPVIAPHARGLVRRDRVARADAVVVLASAIQRSGEPTAAAQQRLLTGYELLRGGYAPRLVLTRLRPPLASYVPVARRQMETFRLNVPILETSPVGNTHDEALAVAELVRRERWNRVLLVTDPTHTRRAGAVFEKAGVRVLCVPAVEQGYDLGALQRPGDRLRAFGDWLYETLGYHSYRLRGWI